MPSRPADPSPRPPSARWPAALVLAVAAALLGAFGWYFLPRRVPLVVLEQRVHGDLSPRGFVAEGRVVVVRSTARVSEAYGDGAVEFWVADRRLPEGLEAGEQVRVRGSIGGTETLGDDGRIRRGTVAVAVGVRRVR